MTEVTEADLNADSSQDLSPAIADPVVEKETDRNPSDIVVHDEGAGTVTNSYPDGTVRTQTVTKPVLVPTLALSINASSYEEIKTELESLFTYFSNLDGSSVIVLTNQLPNGGNSSLSYTFSS